MTKCWGLGFKSRSGTQIQSFKTRKNFDVSISISEGEVSSPPLQPCSVA